MTAGKIWENCWGKSHMSIRRELTFSFCNIEGAPTDRKDRKWLCASHMCLARVFGIGTEWLQ